MMQKQMMGAFLADDEVAVAFADGSQSCGKDGGMNSDGSVRGGGGGGNCKPADKPSANPQDGCVALGTIGYLGRVGKYGGFEVGAAICNTAADNIKAGQRRTDAAIDAMSNGKAPPSDKGSHQIGKPAFSAPARLMLKPAKPPKKR